MFAHTRLRGKFLAIHNACMRYGDSFQDLYCTTFHALLPTPTAKLAAPVFAPQALNTGILPSMHSFCSRRFEALVFDFGNDWRSMATDAAGVFLWGLTFEVSGRRRQDARARLATMYRVPPTGPWWPAGGAPLDRGVRPY